ALRGARSALFCDSLELETYHIWDQKLWDRFAERFGYRLEDCLQQIDNDPDLLFDYRTIVAEAIQTEFFEEFTAICHEHGTWSRVQCHGTPSDLLAAYAVVDIPESEALLFNPPFSRIAASAAALAQRPVVSAETFTCIYGFVTLKNYEPLRYWHREQVADLKLLADALFAQGVNQIVWHGMPFNGVDGPNEFYASVHVAPDSVFAYELPAFNGYLENVSALMKIGQTASRLAVYLPNEDNLRLQRIPPEDRTPGANYLWEMRHVVVPRETEPFAPLWISPWFLKQADMVDGGLQVGGCRFSALLIDVAWLDGDALAHIDRLSEQGLKVILRREPQVPGKRPRRDFSALLERVRARASTFTDLNQAQLAPLVSGVDLPPFWARQTSDTLFVFFAHPLAREVKYPMRYGLSWYQGFTTRQISIDFLGQQYPIQLVFEPFQSLLVSVSAARGVEFVDIRYQPSLPLPSL
ncbi:MAG: hypothetical protein JSS02_07435, partial [Planctomycetes bacterium]|nr:hypothetical protein [Planctomycetota bacterium]